MVVALGTADGRSHPHRRNVADAIGGINGQILFGLHSTLVRSLQQTVVARGDSLIDCCVRHQVTRQLLARALASLGHDLAAQLVLAESDDDEPERSPTELEPQGRYRVTATLSAPFAGAAYAGVDRVSLQEVELHLLLTEFAEQGPDPGVRAALDAFARASERADALAHPAIRPILRLDSEIGLLVMPRREGPVLRSLIRAVVRVNNARAC